MIKISSINLTLQQIIGNDKLRLLHSRIGKKYVDGKMTDEDECVVYTVLQLGGDFDKFDVKVYDFDTAITEEEIVTSKEPLYVEFENAVCKLYIDRANQIQVSIKADGITVL